MSSVTELLHTKYPLVQAPMNWATDARFVATNGGPGSLSHQATGQGFDSGGRLRRQPGPL